MRDGHTHPLGNFNDECEAALSQRRGRENDADATSCQHKSFETLLTHNDHQGFAR